MKLPTSSSRPRFSLVGTVSHLAYLAIRWALAAVFVYSGAGKLAALEGFSEVISQYGLVLESTELAVAVAIAALEVIAGVGIAFDVRGALATIAALLLLFAGVLAYGIWLGLDIDCSCFGIGDPHGGDGGLVDALVRDLVLAGLCAYLYVWRRVASVELLDPWSRG